jgi:hypothetical protein
MKRIAVVTSGGDAPGMNAAVRAVVRCGIARGLAVLGVQHGYEGLIGGQFKRLGPHDVGGIIGHGGTFLGTTRCEQMKTPAGQAAAARQLESHEVDGLVIGGNGSQAGSFALSRCGVRVVGVASTIDNDLPGSEPSIGCTTAMDIALEAIDRLRVTASAHRRAFLVEVMGTSQRPPRAGRRHYGRRGGDRNARSGPDAGKRRSPDPPGPRARQASRHCRRRRGSEIQRRAPGKLLPTTRAAPGIRAAGHEVRVRAAWRRASYLRQATCNQAGGRGRRILLCQRAWHSPGHDQWQGRFDTPFGSGHCDQAAGHPLARARPGPGAMKGSGKEPVWRTRHRDEYSRHTHTKNPAHTNPYVAVRDAFRAARRQLGQS